MVWWVLCIWGVLVLMLEYIVIVVRFSLWVVWIMCWVILFWLVINSVLMVVMVSFGLVFSLVGVFLGRCLGFFGFLCWCVVW